MQSKTSFFNKALFKKNLSRTWIVGVVYFIILLIILPIYYVLNTGNSDNYIVQYGYNKEMAFLSQMDALPAAEFGFAVSIVVIVITFWYLFNKRDSYMIHSFPVSRKTLFCTGLLSSLIISITPVVLTAIIMTLLAASSGIYTFAAIWYWVFHTVVSTLICTSIALFAVMCSGQLITAICFYAIFNFLYSMMETSFRLVASRLMFGMAYISRFECSPLSPAIYLREKCGVDISIEYDNYGNISKFTTSYTGVKYLVIYLIVAAVIAILAFLLYKTKKNERVHDFITVPIFKPVFCVGVSFFVSMVLGTMASSTIASFGKYSYDAKYIMAILFALVIGVILFYATNMMIEKTLRVFDMKRGFHCAYYSIAALVIFLCLRFDAFGVESKVPDVKDIEWVGVQSEYTMTFTDPKEIAKITELHKILIDDKKEIRNLEYFRQNEQATLLTIKYKLKNGKTVSRYYNMMDIESPFSTADYTAAAQPFLDYLNSPEIIKEHILGNIWNDCDVTNVYFEKIIQTENGNYVTYPAELDVTESERLAKNKRVYKALLKDIDNGRVLNTEFGQVAWDDSSALANQFEVTLENKNVEYFSDEQTFDEWEYYVPLYNRTITISLNPKCENTIKALTDEGYLDNASEIVTRAYYYQ